MVGGGERYNPGLVFAALAGVCVQKCLLSVPVARIPMTGRNRQDRQDEVRSGDASQLRWSVPQ